MMHYITVNTAVGEDFLVWLNYEVLTMKLPEVLMKATLFTNLYWTLQRQILIKSPINCLSKIFSRFLKLATKFWCGLMNFCWIKNRQVILDRQFSSERSATSDVPQVSVLGPTLFLEYMNDIPELVNCNIGLIAGDTLIYQVVNDLPRKSKFQTNINSLHHWATTWCMSCNIDKCSILAYNVTVNSPNATYSLDGIPLSIVEETKLSRCNATVKSEVY